MATVSSPVGCSSGACDSLHTARLRPLYYTHTAPRRASVPKSHRTVRAASFAAEDADLITFEEVQDIAAAR